MNENTLVIAYGFEYDKVIINDYDCRIGRTINGDKPVYCSLFIEDIDVNTTIGKIKLTEKYREHYLTNIDKLAKRKGAIPKWQLVIYNKEYELLHSRVTRQNIEL